MTAPVADCVPADWVPAAPWAPSVPVSTPVDWTPAGESVPEAGVDGAPVPMVPDGPVLATPPPVLGATVEKSVLGVLDVAVSVAAAVP